MRSPAVLLCRVQLSTARLCPCFASGEDCSKYSKLCGSLHQREQHSRCVVKFLTFLRSAAIDLPAIASYHSLTDGHAVTTRRPDRLPLPHPRKAGRRWNGCRL